MKYSIVYADSSELLIELVEEAIDAGFRPLGGVTVEAVFRVDASRGTSAPMHRESRFYQAIIKE